MMEIWQPSEEGKRLFRKLIKREKEREDREKAYPMTDKRKEIQIDCRNTDCEDYRPDGDCANIAPAITLNTNGKYVCWSKEERDEDDEEE
jgi:hypothetical protein